MSDFKSKPDLKDAGSAVYGGEAPTSPEPGLEEAVWCEGGPALHLAALNLRIASARTASRKRISKSLVRALRERAAILRRPQRRPVGGDPATYSLDFKATGGDSQSGEGCMGSRYWPPRYAVWDAAKGLAGLDYKDKGSGDKLPYRVTWSGDLKPAASAVYGGEAPPSPEQDLAEAAWWEAEELEDTEDMESVYFKYLVDKFLAAAYYPGMNGAVATGPEQQEAATTPSASTQARAARQVSELQSAKEDVATGSGVAQTSLIRMVPRERWTWKNHTTMDGADGLTVTSSTKKQPRGDTCLPTATASVMESNLKVQHNKNCLLSLDNLVQLSHDCKTKYPDIEVATERFFFIVETEGVLSEDDYKNPETARDAVRYRITVYRPYRIDDPNSMRHALYKMRRTGPLMGVIRISKNYDECAKSGNIYKYNPDLVEKDDKPETHAVCIISFAIENLPYLECQNTHGEKYKDYLKIDVTSLCQLWSLVVQ